MTWLGVFGIILGLASYPWAVVRATRTKFAAFALLYLVHLASTFVYYQYALVSASDSSLYYYDPYGFYADGVGLGTAFVIYFVQTAKSWFGGTYLDYFLLFQAFGFFGISTLMRIFHEVFEEIGREQPVYAHAILFLPGFHFWTSTIGKDGPLFAAICLALWAAMNIKRRYIGFSIAIALMVLFRPHVGLISMIAVAVALLLDRGTSLAIRTLLIMFVLAGAALAVSTIQSTFQVDVTSANSVSDFLSGREEITERAVDGMNTAVIDAPFVIKLFSLLFRPLFFDANDFLGYVASAENTVVMVIFIISFRSLRILAKLSSVAYIRFALVYSIGITTLLTLMYYNVGLGLRQKVMFMPAVLVIFVTVKAVRHLRDQRTIAAVAAA